MFWRILSTRWPLNSLKAALRATRPAKLETFRSSQVALDHRPQASLNREREATSSSPWE